jgi:transposase
MMLEELRLIEEQIGKLDQEMADLFHSYQDQVKRLTEVPGLGVDSAQQILAESGQPGSGISFCEAPVLVGRACPGDNQSAGVNYSHRSPKGNRAMRRILNQAANAAAKAKGTISELVYRRSVSRLRHKQTIGAIAHRLCRLIWMISHDGVHYEERGPAVSKGSNQRRAWRMIRELRSLAYRVELENAQQPNPA